MRVGLIPPGRGSQTHRTPRLLGCGITLRHLKHEEWAPGLTAGGQELDVDIPWVKGDQKIYCNQTRDAFHSTQEDQWDSPPESLPDDSDKESDDIVAYDTTMSRYTTRSE